MIRLEMGPGGDFDLSQADVPPTVYLDHWALRRFSETSKLFERLADGLCQKQGTLSLSWANYLEFSEVTVRDQAAAERFLNQMSPNIGFIEVNPWGVIEREDEIIRAGKPAAPHLDGGMLKALLVSDRGSLDPLSFTGLFSLLTESEVSDRKNELADIFVERMKLVQQQFHKNREFAKQALKPPKTDAVPWGTRHMLTMLVSTLIRDASATFERADAFDFFHCVVPAAYCDYVLLDGRWTDQIMRVTRALRKAGHKFHIADVYSARGKGIDGFLESLLS